MNVIAAFVQMPDGRIASTRSELTELEVVVPGDGAPDELILLDALAGVSYVYDDSAQTIELELPDKARITKKLNGTGGSDFAEAVSGNGVVLNYTGYASSNYNLPASLLSVDGASLSLDARAFSKFGTLRQTGILGTTTFSDFTALRLDTNWSFSDQGSMRTYSLGDIISGGLNWTRPVRLGGAQVQRNFGLRPDLITMPLPQIDGSAEVPSTLRVFVGDVQTYSTDMRPGPFRVDSLPVYTNSGTARIVMTESTGREVTTEQAFYTNPELLKRDLYDYSLEAGVVRRGFGTESFGYATTPVGIASLRYGITNSLTGEAHVEASRDLINVGLGGLFSADQFGIFSGAVAGSLHGKDQGLFLHAGWEAQFGDLGVTLYTSRTIGDFNDLASVTEEPQYDEIFMSGVPLAFDQIGLTYSFPELKSGVGANFIHQIASDGTMSMIFSASYTQSLSNNMTLFVNGFSDFGDSHQYGAFVGFSMPFGGDISTSIGGTVSKDGWSAVAEASRPMNDDPSSYSWRVSHGEGDQNFTSADAAYRTSKATLDGRIYQQDGSISGAASIEGSAVMAGGAVFLGNRIDDSFAVVDAGAEGVSVEYENRIVGKTDKNGKLLLANLRAYEKNKISIDVNDLPLNADIPESEAIVVPRQMSGVVLDFSVKKDANAALLVLTDGEGNFLPEGTQVNLVGSSEPSVMGYDGQVYLTGLTAHNRVTANSKLGSCESSFDFSSVAQTQVIIGPLECH